ncbi:MAG: HD domain-containing protein [Lachnospiraceae bacterium]|nr:HD domain-containing protein [Lachnospiraceae bacterium]
MTDRVNQILQNEEYQQNYYKNEECEVDRVFCKHDMVHFLDVARIAQIINLKEELLVSEELIYAAALLHDIGRHEQYRKGIRHEEASAVIARDILPQCGFDEKETDVILRAIRHHRTVEIKEQGNLDGILYRADKLSRACFACKAEKDCNWKGDKKNHQLLQ